jgi:hypothetical protein
MKQICNFKILKQLLKKKKERNIDSISKSQKRKKTKKSNYLQT